MCVRLKIKRSNSILSVVGPVSSRLYFRSIQFCGERNDTTLKVAAWHLVCAHTLWKSQFIIKIVLQVCDVNRAPKNPVAISCAVTHRQHGEWKMSPLETEICGLSFIPKRLPCRFSVIYACLRLEQAMCVNCTPTACAINREFHIENNDVCEK